MEELFSYLLTLSVLQMTKNPCCQPVSTLDAAIYQDAVFIGCLDTTLDTHINYWNCV